jgi:hypothetical protein
VSENGKTPFILRFFQVLGSPGKAFAGIIAAPAFLKPALVITGISLILGIVIAPKMQAFTVWSLEHGPVAVPPEEVEQVLAVASTTVVAGTIASMAVAPWLIWLVIAGLLKIYAMLSARQVPFKTLFAVAVYGYLPVLLGTTIESLLVLTAPVERVQYVTLSIAALLPPAQSFLYFFLASCSPFTWWSLALWGLGGAAALGIRAAGPVAYLFALWAVWALAAAGLGVLGTPPAGAM